MTLDVQSSKDLEFNRVKEILAEYCKSLKAKSNAQNIKPFRSIDILSDEMAILNEIQAVHNSPDVSFPHPKTEEIDHALRLLDIDNGVLILDELIKVYQLCIGTQELIKFSVKNKKDYPLVYEACAHIVSVDLVLNIIRAVLSDSLQIKDDATASLLKIRQQIKSSQIAVNKNFDRILSSYRKADVLGDSEETFYENRRLLVVVSAHKKKVKGKSYGASTKGVFTYVEPFENIELNKTLEKLRLEESNEIFKILKEITEELRSERKNLEAFQRLLVRFDLYNAKILFAKSYAGICPKISKSQSMYWRGAVHPLLFLKNKELDEPTIDQEVELEKSKRFLVVSGPNAGGKSITLKTVGLLQLMFQSGLFVPVDDVSEFCWFDTILSDIGDNQSIDNQLSTYSYRLSRMKYFLEVVDANSLVLLDEFGSGSDPELGGALAEVFFEQLYAKQCFAMINTHYTNIKILTSSLPEAVNACMLFDTVKLRPMYKLSVGQPGSSFTFEVAKLNGIDGDLIEQAKAKVSESKVKLDDLALSLQQEKSDFNKINKEQLKTSGDARRLIDDYENRLEKLLVKASQQTRFFEQQSKFIHVGKKIFELIGKYKKHKTNKALNEDVRKFVAIERSKALDQPQAIALDRGITAPKLPKQSPQKIKKLKEVEVPKVQKPVKLGDRVHIPNYSKTGVVQELKGKNAIVLIGNFTVKVGVKDLTHPSS